MRSINKCCPVVFNGCLFFLVSLIISPIHAADQYEPIDWHIPVSKFSEFGLDYQKVAQITNDGLMVVVANPQDFTFWNARNKAWQEYKNKKIDYVVAVIDAPVDEIREMVWDLESQEKFSPLLNDTTILSTDGNIRIGKYEQEIKVPIIKIVSDFIVQFNKYDDGDVGMVLIDEGDIESFYHYWEFFPLGENKTLTVLSGWQDIESASFMLKVLLSAEPALGKVFPILTMYERLRQFRDEVARRHPDRAPAKDDSRYSIRTATGYINDNKALDLQELKKLTQLGNVQFYQTAKNVSHDGKVTEISQVSALEYIPLPKSAIQPLLSDFNSLVEYNELTYGWFDRDSTGEDWAFLELAVRIGPFRVPVDIYLIQEQVDEDRMRFFTADHSYMYPLTGHIEFVELPDNEGTIVGVNFGGVVGPDASFIFKMARYLPFHNVLIAAAYATVTADSMEAWVVERVAKDNYKPSDSVVSNL
ncbi:MAG: hypothetical protein COB04_02795 [Gammaproteobacteria bacterium]|nr:MAG: hypothetical protein COB04_02795 [Gammaproteobacteria bacterium]